MRAGQRTVETASSRRRCSDGSVTVNLVEEFAFSKTTFVLPFKRESSMPFV